MKFFMSPDKQRPFWLRYLILLGFICLIVFGASALVQLFGGTSQVSNFFFLSTLVLLVMAVIPIFTEMGGNLRAAGKTLRGEEAEDLIKAQAARSRSGAQKTYLFGLLGITTFILSLVFI
jgi:hypothetical protein